MAIAVTAFVPCCLAPNMPCSVRKKKEEPPPFPSHLSCLGGGAGREDRMEDRDLLGKRTGQTDCHAFLPFMCHACFLLPVSSPLLTSLLSLSISPLLSISQMVLLCPYLLLSFCLFSSLHTAPLSPLPVYSISVGNIWEKAFWSGWTGKTFGSMPLPAYHCAVPLLLPLHHHYLILLVAGSWQAFGRDICP